MSDLKHAQKVAEVATERAKVMQRLEELDTELASLLKGGVATAAKPASGKTTRNRTAPSSTATASNGKSGKKKRRRGRPKKSDQPQSDVKVDVDGSGMELPDLLTVIAQEVKKPMQLADFLAVVLASGYQSEAKDKSNMVYQALNKLVKRGTLKKDTDTREYVIADAA